MAGLDWLALAWLFGVFWFGSKATRQDKALTAIEICTRAVMVVLWPITQLAVIWIGIRHR